MNRFNNISKPLLWFMAFLLTAFMAGCGGGNGVASSSAKAITQFSLSGVNGVINETAKTILVTMQPGTNTTALVATYTHTGNNVKVGATIQVSGTTMNNFTAPVAYKVTAADGTWATYTVIATVTSPTTKAITSYILAGATGVITEPAHTIAVTVPNGTSVTSLIATYVSTGASVKVGTTVQTSATTANNFTTPLAYTVTAGDGTTATYTVTVTVASASAKAITTYSLGGIAGVITEPAHTIAVTMQAGTNVTAQIATFTTTAANVEVGATAQTSGTTANDFTAPVAYTVTAADTSTVTYTVTVTVASGPAPVLLGAAANYAVLAKTGISTVPTSVITGNVGVSPAARPYLTGWSLITEPTDTYFTSAQVSYPGQLHAADNVGGTTSSDLGTAVLNMGTAYTDAAGRTATSGATTNVGAGTLTSLTLTPGVYEWGSNVSIPTNLTLNGNATDVWIFKIAGTLTMAAAKNVILTGGALPQNIFWQVSGAVNVGTGTHFEGIILGQTSITFGNLTSINGRLLAQTAVVLDATTVTQP